MFESCRDRHRALRDYANKISYFLAVRNLFLPEKCALHDRFRVLRPAFGAAYAADTSPGPPTPRCGANAVFRRSYRLGH
jgi:hypothetical protein